MREQQELGHEQKATHLVINVLELKSNLGGVFFLLRMIGS
jgi:hypothetical protein